MMLSGYTESVDVIRCTAQAWLKPGGLRYFRERDHPCTRLHGMGDAKGQYQSGEVQPGECCVVDEATRLQPSTASAPPSLNGAVDQRHRQRPAKSAAYAQMRRHVARFRAARQQRAWRDDRLVGRRAKSMNCQRISAGRQCLALQPVAFGHGTGCPCGVPATAHRSMKRAIRGSRRNDRRR